jgi:hypothetical protein
VRPDIQQDAVDATASIGVLNLQATVGRTDDNLGHLASILTTRTRTRSLTASLPLSSALGGASWLPVVSATLLRVHQFGDGVPPNSEFSASHVPDQLSTNQTVSATWQLGRASLDYRLNLSDQDNRQIGRELSDFANATHGVSIGLRASEAIQVALSVGFEGAENSEFKQTNRTRNAAGTVDWRLTSKTTLATAFSTTRLQDTPRTSEQSSTELRLELSQQIPLVRLRPGTSPGQMFVRFARQANSVSAPAIPRMDRRTWSIATGLTISML